jgi:phi LC3 family holin
MINWKVRIKNKNFWISAIPAALLLIQVIASIFGFQLDLGEIGNKLLAVVNAAFAFLAILGVVNDPTTEGLSDSQQAMTYDKPKEKQN